MKEGMESADRIEEGMETGLGGHLEAAKGKRWPASFPRLCSWIKSSWQVVR